MHVMPAHIPFRRARPLWAAAAAAVLVAAPLAPAASAGSVAESSAPAAAASGFVEKLGAQVIDVLEKHPAEDQAARAAALDRIFEKAFDVNGMARFAAGLYWRRSAPAERARYVELFGRYVSHLYAQKFARYSGQSFVVGGTRDAGHGVTAVTAKIVSDSATTPIEFRVRKANDGYRIVDVYVAGVSLLITKRDEFNTVLAREGMEGLLQRLEKTASG